MASQDTLLSPHLFEKSFAPDLQRVGLLRRATRDFLRRHGVPESTEGAVVLAVSELVTNAVIHGEGEVKLRISLSCGGVRVCVTDQNPSPAVLKDPENNDESGRGMRLVHMLADTWGSSGEETWCAFRCPSDGTA